MLVDTLLRQLDVAYLDTSAIAPAVMRSRGWTVVRPVLDDLIVDGTTVLVSELTRIELAQAMKAIANDPNALPASERRRRQLHRWGDVQAARDEWYQHCFQNYDALLGQFVETQELKLNRDVIDAAVHLMAAFQFDSFDALHAATAIAMKATMFVTMDADFLKIAGYPGLDVRVLR